MFEKNNFYIKQISATIILFLFAFSFANAQTLPSGGGIDSNSLFPLSARCSVAPAKTRTNTAVTWTATATGGTGNYTFKWNGANMDQSTSPTVTVAYGSIGTKNATVTVTSGSSVVEVSCFVTITNNDAVVMDPNESNEAEATEREEFVAEAGEDSEARRLSGEVGATGEGEILKMLEGLIGGVLECSIENILAQGLQGILNGLGDSLFGGTELGGQLNEGGGVVDELLAGVLTQPMVPTNPVPIVKPINNVAAKEIGVSVAGGLFQMPALDAIAYCLANSVIQYSSEGTARWLNTGFQGNPAFIENYGRFFRDVRDLETERYLQELSASQSCGTVDANIASQLARQEQHRGVASQQCNPAFAQPENINNARSRGEFLDPSNNPTWRGMQAYVELQERKINAQELARIEAVDANQGFLSQRDDDREIIVPAPIYLADATKKLNVPTERLSQLDEIGEILQELFKAVVTMVPGGILRKVLEEI